ncbi:MAG: DUF3343 domain-containing protein [Clostridiales bacterium]|nr:DUF3343 domain-containing protein [Clostridiales bacterium]
MMAHNTNCTIGVKSITYAMKAQQRLSEAGIYSSVIRLSPNQSPNGCTNGLAVDCREVQKASGILNIFGINHSILN